jgi:hypothetical protein
MSGPPTRERPPAVDRGAEAFSTSPTNLGATLPQPRERWRFTQIDESPIGEMGIKVTWRQMLPDCPEQHRERLRAARVRRRCKVHDCSLCFLRFGAYCIDCELEAIAVFEREGPPEDPFCSWHGGLLSATSRDRSCPTCTAAWSRAKRAGWRRPTGHQGVDCTHCWRCGRCPGTGRVCRCCQTCDEHAFDLEDPLSPWDDCVRLIWSRAYRRDVAFHVAEVFDPTTGRWRT